MGDHLSSREASRGDTTTAVTLLTPQWTTSDWLWGAGQIVRALRAVEQAVTVVVFRKGEIQAQQWTQQAGAEVVLVRVRGFWDWRGLSRLTQWLRQRSVSIVLSLGAEATALAMAVRARGVSRRCAVAAMEALPVGQGLRGWFLSRALRRVDRILLPTRASATPYLQLGVPSDRLSWIAPVAEAFPPFPGTPGESFSLPASGGRGEGLSLPASAQLLLHFCTSEDDSGARQAIVTHDILRYHRPHLHLLVVASSSQQSHRLATFAHRLAVDDLRVHVLPLEQLKAWPSAGTVVLVTSRHRCAPVAVTAMAHGAVVVGWRMPELVEILHDDLSAWLVTEGKTAELAERVRRLIDNPALMLAGIQASRERASHFTPQRMQTQLHGLYNDLLGMKTVADDPTTGSCSIMSTPR